MTGNGPPPEYSSGALLAALLERPRPSKVIAFPSEQAKGTPFEKIRVVVPPADAQRQAQLAAHRRMQALNLPMEEWKTETGAGMLGDFVAKEVLARMLFGLEEHTPGVYARIFANSTDVEKALSSDEIAVLFEHVARIQLELGPRLQVLTDAQVDAWVEVLKGGFDPLAYLQSPDLELLIRGLHRRLVRERARSNGSSLQDSPRDNLLNSSESEPETCATDITSFGELRARLSSGSSDALLSTDDARAVAKSMARKSTTSE
jgi:hypothetical protein